MFALIGPNIRSLSKSFFTIIIDVIAQWIIRIAFAFSENKVWIKYQKKNSEKNSKSRIFPKNGEKNQKNLLE